MYGKGTTACFSKWPYHLWRTGTLMTEQLYIILWHLVVEEELEDVDLVNNAVVVRAMLPNLVAVKLKWVRNPTLSRVKDAL